MTHHTGPWAHPPRKRQPRATPFLIVAIGVSIATGLAVLITGGW
jgi:uncharacterized RDD family membrane protein YckC